MTEPGPIPDWHPTGPPMGGPMMGKVPPRNAGLLAFNQAPTNHLLPHLHMHMLGGDAQEREVATQTEEFGLG